MKNTFIFYIIFSGMFLFGACSSYSEFFVNNLSDSDLEVDIESVYDGVSQSGISVNAKQTVKIAEMRFIESSGPTPAQVLSSITVRVPSESNRVIFSQNPVSNGGWLWNETTTRSIGPSDHAFTLMISNSHL